MILRKTPLLLVSLILLNPLSQRAYAQAQKEDPVRILDVDFRDAGGLTDHMIRIEVDANPSRKKEKGSSSKYVDNVKIAIILAYKHPREKGKFIYYTSEVTIATMKEGHKKVIAFWMPYDIVERNRLSKTPHSWVVNISMNGSLIPPNDRNYRKRLSPSLQNLETFQDFRREASGAIEGVLKPTYLTNNTDPARKHEVPAYIRTDK